MENIKNNEHNLIADNDLEQVAAGGIFERLEALLFGKHCEETTDQTEFSDENVVNGTW